MKIAKTNPEYLTLNVRILILIYTLLCVLTFLFSRNFFIETLNDGKIPDGLHLIVFFTIPAALLIILGISFFKLVLEFILRRPGSRSNVRLLVYFAVIVIFSITPITVMTSSALIEIVRFWQSIDAAASNRAVNNFIADNYSLHLERFDSIIKNNDFTNYKNLDERLPSGIVSVQVFILDNEIWENDFFTGDEQFSLPLPPSMESGFSAREMPRDLGTIRFLQLLQPDTAVVVSYDLGSDFDTGKAILENQIIRFETLNQLRRSMQPLLIYFYAVFFLPTLLTTVIIAISFTRQITHPIVQLTEAIQRVAEGDFSIHILTRRNDELGMLIRTFNTMVQDLEKSRAALVKSEKITIWQNMAQQLAHEIKNPLTPIKLSAERVLRRWQNEPENIGEILESSMMAIIQETEGLSSLLNEFRTLSKPMEPSNSITDLQLFLEDAVTTYSNSYPKVKFDISNVQKETLLKIDKNRLSQIMTNLFLNAIAAMNEEGVIEIRADLVKKQEACYCRISIKDSGKGINWQDGKKIFTPYYTTKESGTGLGLPIVERIVNSHGGGVWFDSAENAGTTFYVDLPEA